MKTIRADTNPAFKQAQLLPVILDLLPPTAGGAARHYSEITSSSPATDRAQTMGSQHCSERKPDHRSTRQRNTLHHIHQARQIVL